jgi:hypothetical protein
MALKVMTRKTGYWQNITRGRFPVVSKCATHTYLHVLYARRLANARREYVTCNIQFSTVCQKYKCDYIWHLNITNVFSLVIESC